MKIFDMHTHIYNDGVNPDPKLLINEMEKAGVYGGVVMSQDPLMPPFSKTPSIEDRTTEVLNWTKGYENRLFPALWIHPYEENVIEEVKKASNRGIMAFKIICSTFYVYDNKCMDLLNCIAKLRKPVLFHSGILWDGQVSSKYNKPVNWEALLDIPGIKFSMGHCSWPWHDECIALYGKFLNSYATNPDASAEMFFDTTPGTPEIYREDLLKKMFTIGYDVPHNILFGSDCTASCYNHEWTKKWIEIDKAIMDNIGVPQKVREWIYNDNLMRFLGLEEKNFTHISPVPDSGEMWSLNNI